MKTIDEKEKKLENVLNELKKLELTKPSEIEELDLLKNQKTFEYRIREVETQDNCQYFVDVCRRVKLKVRHKICSKKLIV